MNAKTLINSLCESPLWTADFDVPPDSASKVGGVGITLGLKKVTAAIDDANTTETQPGFVPLESRDPEILAEVQAMFRQLRSRVGDTISVIDDEHAIGDDVDYAEEISWPDMQARCPKTAEWIRTGVHRVVRPSVRHLHWNERHIRL